MGDHSGLRVTLITTSLVPGGIEQSLISFTSQFTKIQVVAIVYLGDPLTQEDVDTIPRGIPIFSDFIQAMDVETDMVLGGPPEKKETVPKSVLPKPSFKYGESLSSETPAFDLSESPWGPEIGALPLVPEEDAPKGG